MKYLLVILVSLLLPACSANYAEDENYVHIRKEHTACKVVSKNEVHPSKSNPYLEVKYKCVYIKTVNEDFPPQTNPELLKLLQELDSDA